MADRTLITRRGLAAIAATAGLAGRSLRQPASPRQASDPAGSPRLRRAAEALDKADVPRETQPAFRFLP